VMVLAGVREPVQDAVLERVVYEGDQPQPCAARARLATGVDLLEEVGDVEPDRPLGVGRPRLSPGEALEQLGLVAEGDLEQGFRLETGDELSDVQGGG